MDINISKKARFSTLLKFAIPDQQTIPDFNADEGEIVYRYEDHLTIIYCGLGSTDTITTTKVRCSAAKGIQKALDLKRTEVSIIIEGTLCSPQHSRAVIEGIILGSYKFDKYKSETARKIQHIEIIGSPLNAADLKKTKSIACAVNYARDLVNSNAHEITPVYLEKEARNLSENKNVSLEILTEKEMKKNGLNLLYAVGKASQTPPRLIIINYKGDPRSNKKIAIAGKGITLIQVGRT
jgi:leucyl aminopeptidase